jgi:hypothetical protein
MERNILVKDPSWEKKGICATMVQITEIYVCSEDAE